MCGSDTKRAQVVLAVLRRFEWNVPESGVHLVRENFSKGRDCKRSIILKPVIVEEAERFTGQRSSGLCDTGQFPYLEVIGRVPHNIAFAGSSRPESWGCMMKIVIRGQVPQHRLSVDELVIAKKEIVSLLSLFVQEGVVVVTLETLNHITGVTCPLINLPVCFHCVDKM